MAGGRFGLVASIRGGNRGSLLLDAALLLGITSPLWIATILVLCGHMPSLSGLFNGRDIITPLEHEPAAIPNYIRNFFELTSFVATTVVMVTALAAIAFTLDQIAESKNARLATVYMAIVDRWNSTDQVNSRKLRNDLARAFTAANPGLADEDMSRRRMDYIAAQIAEAGAADPMKERQYLLSLYMFEDLGILCRKNYVKQDDLFDFIGEHIVATFEDLLTYISQARAAGEAGDAIYANAAYLYAEAKRHAEEHFTYPLPP